MEKVHHVIAHAPPSTRLVLALLESYGYVLALPDRPARCTHVMEAEEVGEMACDPPKGRFRVGPAAGDGGDAYLSATGDVTAQLLLAAKNLFGATVEGGGRVGNCSVHSSCKYLGLLGAV